MPQTIGILGLIYSKDEVQKIRDEYETKLAALRIENERLQNSVPAASAVQSTEQSSQSQEAVVLEISEAGPAKTGRVLRTRRESPTGKTGSMATKKRKKFACPDCEKSYVFKDSVRRHQGDVHGPRVSCQHCGHSTTQDRVELSLKHFETDCTAKERGN